MGLVYNRLDWINTNIGHRVMTWKCPDCSAVVIDTKVHDQFHSLEDSVRDEQTQCGWLGCGEPLDEKMGGAIRLCTKHWTTGLVGTTTEPVKEETVDPRKLSDWQKLNNEVTRLTQQVGDLTMQNNILGAGMSDLNERLGKLEGSPSPMIGPLRDEVAAAVATQSSHDERILDLHESVELLTTAVDRIDGEMRSHQELVQTLEAGFNTEYKILNDDQKKLMDTQEVQLGSIRDLHDTVKTLTNLQCTINGTMRSSTNLVEGLDKTNELVDSIIVINRLTVGDLNKRVEFLEKTLSDFRENQSTLNQADIDATGLVENKIDRLRLRVIDLENKCTVPQATNYVTPPHNPINPLDKLNFRIIPLGGNNMISVQQGFGGVIDVTLDGGMRYRVTVAAKTGEYQITEQFGKWDVV